MIEQQHALEQIDGMLSPPHDPPKLPATKNMSSKSTKPSHRISKRARTSSGHTHPHSPLSPDSSHATHSMSEGRHKRVWKACERCRMKKTKCDGEFPCKRCKDDGLVCAPGTRKKTEFKQLPRGYAEVLEHTQLTLVATVHKLYSMLRNGEPWTYGEPGVNDRGSPVVHNIAQVLGCIRPNGDIDLPVHSQTPQDEQDLANLASQIEEVHQSEKGASSAADTRTERASSSSDDDHTDFEDYRRAAFGRHTDTAANLSPVSLPYDTVDAYSLQSNTTSPTTVAMPSSESQWPRQVRAMESFTNTPFLQQPNYGRSTMEGGSQIPDEMLYQMLMNQGLNSPQQFDSMAKHEFPNSEFLHVMEMGNPPMYAGADFD